MIRKRLDDGGLVYSTEHGKMCPKCSRPLSECRCGSHAGKKSDGIVRVGRETSGRKGKGVTVITGAPVTLGELADLAADLKKKCGSGGTVKEGVIEIQGDHRDLIVAELTRRGFTVKRSGG